MKHFLPIVFSTFFITMGLQAQVGIGTTNPDASSVLDISATDKGILIPKVSLSDVSDTMIDGVNPSAMGLLIYNTNAGTTGGSGVGYYYFNGTIWERLATSVSSEDHDFYEVGTTTSPDDINDDQFTMGNLAIGKNTADYPLDIQSATSEFGTNVTLNGTDNIGRSGYYANISNSGNGRHYGFRAILDGAGTNDHGGIYNQIFGSGSGDQLGVYSTIGNNGSGNHYGVNSILSGTGTGEQYGTYSRIINSGNADHYGAYNLLSGSGSGTHYGNWTRMEGTGSGVHFGEFIRLEGTGTGPHKGTEIQLSGSGMGNQLGTINVIDNTGNGLHYGNYNVLTGTGTGDHFGNWTKIVGSGSGIQYGNRVEISNSANNIHYGEQIVLNGIGSGTHYGSYNLLTGTGTGSQVGYFAQINNSGNDSHYGGLNRLEGAGSGDQIGLLNLITNTGSGNHYGMRNTLNANANGEKYGVNNIINGSGTSDDYGIYNELTGSGSGNKYGIYNNISNTAGGTHYGIYSEALKAGSFAGYFLGNVSIGTTTANNYILPISRGTVNQLMQTDGVGNVTWVDDPSPSYWSRTGGVLNLATATDDITFTSDQTSITFPNTTGTPPSMIYMFQGAGNVDRMVIAHSPSFPDWGLEYEDTTDSFIFKSQTQERVEIDLAGGFPLRVYGTARAQNFQSDTTTYPDYVFESYFKGYSDLNSEYSFKTLTELESFILENGHLPNVKSFEEVKADGMTISLSDMTVTNLEKIEEAFLYIIELKKQNDVLQTKLKSQQCEIDEIKALLKK